MEKGYSWKNNYYIRYVHGKIISKVTILLKRECENQYLILIVLNGPRTSSSPI